jgi:hypothetical protein
MNWFLLAHVSFGQLVKDFAFLYLTRTIITLFTRRRQWILPWIVWCSPSFSYNRYVFKIHHVFLTSRYISALSSSILTDALCNIHSVSWDTSCRRRPSNALYTLKGTSAVRLQKTTQGRSQPCSKSCQFEAACEPISINYYLYIKQTLPNVRANSTVLARTWKGK